MTTPANKAATMTRMCCARFMHGKISMLSGVAEPAFGGFAVGAVARVSDLAGHRCEGDEQEKDQNAKCHSGKSSRLRPWATVAEMPYTFKILPTRSRLRHMLRNVAVIALP